MRPPLVLPFVVTAAIALAAPSGAAAQMPTLTMEQDCSRQEDGVQVYAVSVGLTGFPPNVDFSGKLEMTYINPPVNPDGTSTTGGSIGPVTFTTDANGNFGPLSFGTVGVATIFTATVEYAGGTLTKTLRVTCRPNSKDECKDGGWKSFGGVFKNQGDCVSYVAKGSKDPPARG